jgi:hypothetical protein
MQVNQRWAAMPLTDTKGAHHTGIVSPVANP